MSADRLSLFRTVGAVLAGVAVLHGWLGAARVDAANTVSATTAAALGPVGSARGLQIDLVDAVPRNPAWVYAGPGQGLNDESSLEGSFFVDPQGVSMSTTAGFNSFQMLDFLESVGGNSPAQLIFHLNRGPTGWFINVWHWNQNLNGGQGNYQFSGGGFFALANNAAWHNNRINFQWSAGNPGHLTMWRTLYTNRVPDPSGTIQMFSVSLPGMQNVGINYIFAGMFASHDPGTSGRLLLDEFSFSR